MSDVLDDLANTVAMIRADAELRKAFIQALQFGPSTQQVRASILLDEITSMGAPDEVKKFVRILANEKVASQVLAALQD